jgi:hypothetical protein
VNILDLMEGGMPLTEVGHYYRKNESSIPSTEIYAT